MTKKIVLTLLLVITTTISFSQYTWTNGEVTLKNGKTISGEVKIPVVSKDLIHFNGKLKVRVKDETNGRKYVFNEDEVELIKFIYSDSEVAYFTYIPFSKKKKEIFCIITTGSVTLYGRAVGMTSSYPGMITFHNLNEFYAQRANEEIATPLQTARPSKSFKNRAIDYFSNCPTVVSKLKNKTLNKDDIIRVVEEYNDCAG